MRTRSNWTRRLALSGFGVVWAATVGLALTAPMLASAAGGADKKIERLWKAKCGSCHGADGTAQTDLAKEQGVADMSKAEWQKAFTDQQLKDATLNGIKREKNGKQQDMKGYKDALKPEEVDGLVSYMRGLAK